MPPTLGTQIDRFGRPAINTALEPHVRHRRDREGHGQGRLQRGVRLVDVGRVVQERDRQEPRDPRQLGHELWQRAVGERYQRWRLRHARRGARRRSDDHRHVQGHVRLPRRRAPGRDLWWPYPGRRHHRRELLRAGGGRDQRRHRRRRRQRRDGVTRSRTSLRRTDMRRPVICWRLGRSHLQLAAAASVPPAPVSARAGGSQAEPARERRSTDASIALGNLDGQIRCRSAAPSSFPGTWISASRSRPLDPAADFTGASRTTSARSRWRRRGERSREGSASVDRAGERAERAAPLRRGAEDWPRRQARRGPERRGQRACGYLQRRASTTGARAARASRRGAPRRDSLGALAALLGEMGLTDEATRRFDEARAHYRDVSRSAGVARLPAGHDVAARGRRPAREAVSRAAVSGSLSTRTRRRTWQASSRRGARWRCSSRLSRARTIRSTPGSSPKRYAEAGRADERRACGSAPRTALARC